jgi:CheY-like chemotaxis protein
MPNTQAVAMLLYGEDELLTQASVSAALRDAGFSVVVADNGTDAVRILETAVEPFRG